MKMGNIAGNRKSWKGITCCSITHICRKSADNLDSICLRGVDNGTSTDAINSNPINEVSMSPFLPCTNISGEETKGVLRDAGVSEPSDLCSDGQDNACREEWYKRLWKFKLRHLRQPYEYDG